MIHRDRGSITPPSILQTKGAAEQLVASSYYNQTPIPQTNMEFFAYKAGDVKEKLNQLFQNKCAYCEGKYLNHPMDIEHFRPKGEIACGAIRVYPGYWWLASSWENLFVSCIDCNRKRYHKLEDGSEFLFGKENKFPLFEEAKRALGPGQEIFEEPLLINPTDDDPADFIGFSFSISVLGEPASLALPIQAQSFKERRGQESIETYGLNRPMLVTARADVIAKMAFSLRSALSMFNLRLAQATDEKARQGKPSTDIVELLRQDLKEILSGYTRSDRPYSAACYAYFRDQMACFSI